MDKKLQELINLTNGIESNVYTTCVINIFPQDVENLRWAIETIKKQQEEIEGIELENDLLRQHLEYVADNMERSVRRDKGDRMLKRDIDEKLKDIKELWACEWSSIGTMSAHVRHDDIGWLIQTLEKTREALSTVYNSYCNTTEAMEIQYEELKVDRDQWKQKYLLLQRQ